MKINEEMSRAISQVWCKKSEPMQPHAGDYLELYYENKEATTIASYVYTLKIFLLEGVLKVA